MATLSAGLRPQHKKAVVIEVLPSGYKVRCDGEEGERRLSEKKVKRLGKPVKLKMGPVAREPPTPEPDAYLEGILDRGDAQRAARDQRPPTRLHISDANVPTIQLEVSDLLPPSARRDLHADQEWVSRPQSKPRKPTRSAAYLQHVREHDCCNCGAPGPSDPDHVGSRGVGQKCSDLLCVPLCRPCHRARTDRNRLPLPDNRPGAGRVGSAVLLRHAPDTELIILRAQVQMLREWAEKQEKEIT